MRRVCAALAGAVLAAAASAAELSRWVQASSLMLREQPSATATVLERLPQGHRLQLVKLPATGDEWCPVWASGHMSNTGYVACRYLSDKPVAPLRAGEAGVPADRRWVTGSRLQLRAEPRADAAVLASLALNTPVRLTEPKATNGYCAVQLVEGQALAGYTACRYLEPSPVDLASLITPRGQDGVDNPDFDPARAFWISPSWELMAFYARRVEQQRATLGDKAPRGPDEQLERMKARLSGQVLVASRQPTVWPDWQQLYGQDPSSLSLALSLYGDLFRREGGDRPAAFLKALPPLPPAAPSWWRSEADLAGPGESVNALASRFGAQVQWLHESLQPGSPNRGAITPGARIERMTQPLRRFSLTSNQTVRDERLAPERTYRDWDPTVDLNCDDWVGGFLYGEADRATNQHNGASSTSTGPYALFQVWSSRPLPPGPARWTRKTFKLDRNLTGFVSGEWRTVDLDNDGIPDLAWLQATGRGPGHIEGPLPYDDAWYRLLLANVAGRWKLLEIDTFSYGCGC